MVEKHEFWLWGKNCEYREIIMEKIYCTGAEKLKPRLSCECDKSDEKWKETLKSDKNFEKGKESLYWAARLKTYSFYECQKNYHEKPNNQSNRLIWIFCARISHFKRLEGLMIYIIRRIS